MLGIVGLGIVEVTGLNLVSKYRFIFLDVPVNSFAFILSCYL